MKSKKFLIAGTIALLCQSTVSAQPERRRAWDDIDSNVVRRDTITKEGFTLIWVEKETAFVDSTRTRMIETFFTTYPKQIALYNKEGRRTVRIVIDPEYKGVAAAGGGVIRVNPEWMIKNPQDIDVVTHEGMHVVQSYPGGAGPGWITEGVADYVRHKMGVNNKAGNWSLTPFRDSHHYTNAYRITARFFVWIESKHGNDFVKKLDNAMRTKTYTEAFWKEQTGKTVDELWDTYKTDPRIEGI